MNFDAKIPMSLYKANLELVMRLGALLQESRQRWTRFGLGSADNAIEKTLNETGRMLTTNDWQSLAALPGATFWKALQGDAGPMQGAIDTAITNQSAFIEGVQDAFTAWQQQCAELIQSSNVPMPGNATLEGFLKAFTPQGGFAAAARSSAPAQAPRSAPPTPTPAPARKPPAKSTAKATAKRGKPAAKKKPVAKAAAKKAKPAVRKVAAKSRRK